MTEESGFGSGFLTSANLIGSDRSHDKWEWILSGVDLGADSLGSRFSRERIPSDWIGRSVTANDRRERIWEQIWEGIWEWTWEWIQDHAIYLSQSDVFKLEIRSRENPLPREMLTFLTFDSNSTSDSMNQMC